MSIVTPPPTACTLECPACMKDTLHRRKWGASDRVCQDCGLVSDKRPAVRVTVGKQFAVVEPGGGELVLPSSPSTWTTTPETPAERSMTLEEAHALGRQGRRLDGELLPAHALHGEPMTNPDTPRLGKPVHLLNKDSRDLTVLARVRRGRARWTRLDIMRIHGRAMAMAKVFGVRP